MSSREITIDGRAVVLALGIVDASDEVYRYIIVLQDRASGDCQVATVLRLHDSDELHDNEGKRFAGGHTAARQDAISHALQLAGYPPLAGEED